MKAKRTSFSGSIGFVLAAAGSAVGLGNLWRFPYLAAKNGGGLFLAVYLVLVLTFGFTLLVSEVAIGRKTKKSPLKAYGEIHPKWKWIGKFAVFVPFLIFPYYCVIGGWVLKYALVYLTGNGSAATEEGYFSGFITSPVEPVILLAVFVFFNSFVIYKGINKGIERISKILMPVLFILVTGIAVFALTMNYSEGGVVRTGLEGLKVYVIPDLNGLTLGTFMRVLLDAMGQLFYSISVAMGIMITYGSYLDDKENLIKGARYIELFDTGVAFLAGIMIIVPLYVVMGREAMGASGPSLLFISMPTVFSRMGGIGTILGAAFFVMVFFAALTSSISIMEAVASSLMEGLGITRKKATVLEGVMGFCIGVVVCLGYNVFYFEIPLPNGAVAQVLDIMDYLSNYIFMPIVAIATCLLIGWVVKPETIVEEATKNGEWFGRRKMYIVMVKFIAPLLLLILFLQSLGIIS
ncbi:MAG: sodium-dependent transporter [Lachnospiraceae bacterium]|nr:sodium-dependent transporter [Lachnospiraceae bacterium]